MASIGDPANFDDPASTLHIDPQFDLNYVSQRCIHVPMATFERFPLLPLELRQRVWELTVELRVVEVRFKMDYDDSPDGKPKVLHVTSSTPVPATLHACREARTHGLSMYQRAFTIGAEPRYVWVNYEMDTISVGDTSLSLIDAEKLLIRRLRTERAGIGVFETHTQGDGMSASFMRIG
ncbi:hypothetical protein PCL_04331 [Purpureocillium lilacinum]|uniref:2EXR domain-containing protein n=2 Tax=Purpureocillium lilacinum TaxID=33203 RepID=A0A2U3DY32_PURLI|nr:hypothetical protein PCL_04331 [Purpureocillium lilacinum]